MQSLELVEYLSVSFRLLSLTIWAIFFSVVLYLSLTEAPLGVNTEVWDALIGGLLETVLHLGGEWCPGPYSNLFFGPWLFWKIKHIQTQIFWVNIWRVYPTRNWTINVFQNWYYHYWVTICIMYILLTFLILLRLITFLSPPFWSASDNFRFRQSVRRRGASTAESVGEIWFVYYSGENVWASHWSTRTLTSGSGPMGALDQTCSSAVLINVTM